MRYFAYEHGLFVPPKSSTVTVLPSSRPFSTNILIAERIVAKSDASSPPFLKLEGTTITRGTPYLTAVSRMRTHSAAPLSSAYMFGKQ